MNSRYLIFLSILLMLVSCKDEKVQSERYVLPAIEGLIVDDGGAPRISEGDIVVGVWLAELDGGWHTGMGWTLMMYVEADLEEGGKFSIDEKIYSDGPIREKIKRIGLELYVLSDQAKISESSGVVTDFYLGEDLEEELIDGGRNVVVSHSTFYQVDLRIDKPSRSFLDVFRGLVMVEDCRLKAIPNSVDYLWNLANELHDLGVPRREPLVETDMAYLAGCSG